MEGWRKHKGDRASKNTRDSITLPKISIHNAQRDLPLSAPHVRKVVSFLLNELKISTDEVIVHFVTEAKICLLHKDYFNDPSPTDCITFPVDGLEDKKGVYHVLGEVFICPKTALLYAQRLRVDPYEELYRYLIHCVLHLIGYEDIAPRDRAKMKQKERACLKKLVAKGLVRYKTL
jgi:probable rRNA maturation factor